MRLVRNRCGGAQVYSLSPSAIGARYGYILSPLPRLVPATGIFSLPFRDGCPLRMLLVASSTPGAPPPPQETVSKPIGPSCEYTRASCVRL
eukprot:1190793-Prorocentrum_minimum.AAC.1